MTKKFLAYHNDPKIKAKYVARMEAHRKADELCQGVGWETNGTTRGCAVGCCFHKYDHARGPIEIGVPEVLIRLEDAIFEGLPKKEAVKWPTRFLKAIIEGTDLALVWPKFAVWMLRDPEHGVIRFSGQSMQARESIERVASLWQRVIEGETVDSLKMEFYSAETIAASAESAAESAAWSAAESAESAESAAWSAARSAWSAAESAAWSARSAWSAGGSVARSAWSAWSAARSAESAESARSAWSDFADKLIELIKATGR